MPGLLQLLALRFPDGVGPDGLVASLDRLQAGGAVRVLDVSVARKDGEGGLVQVFGGDDDDSGGLLSQVFPAHGGVEGAVGELWSQAQSLPAGAAAVFILLENRWAGDVLATADATGGQLLGVALLPSELDLVLDAELAALDDAARSTDVAQAREATAWLRAAAAWEAADNAEVASARLRSAAAAESLRALAAAGLLQQAALQEATDALRAAGLISAAAAQAADQAVAADAVTVAAADEAAADAVRADESSMRAAASRQADAVLAASVTPAEIRVLRYLSTPLTFALIADRLGLSRGAARSRAERAYKKLGVHNRADAVHRAHALRLTPRPAPAGRSKSMAN